MATSCYNLLSWCNNCLLHSPFLFSFRPIIVFSCSPLRCNNFAQWHFYHVTNHKSRGLQSAESVCIDKTPLPGHERDTQLSHNTLTGYVDAGCMFISQLWRAAERKRALGILVEQVLWIAHPFSLSIRRIFVFIHHTLNKTPLPFTKYSWRDPRHWFLIIFSSMPTINILIFIFVSPVFNIENVWPVLGR